jgi:hypothetical protein
MILPGETEAGTAGTQPCRGISRWAHRDDERGRESSFLRRPTSIGSKDPHALKIPARRAEYSLTENVASPFQAEPRQYERNDQKFLLIRDRAERVLKRHPNYRREFDGISDKAVRPEADKGTQFGLAEAPLQHQT